MKQQISNLTLCVGIQVLTTLFCSADPESGAGFEGGTGRPYDPYQIATAEQLLSIGSDITLMSKSFILIKDINLPKSREFDSALISCTADIEAAKIDDPAYYIVGHCLFGVFRGNFFGNGHAIRNMVIKASDGECVGLFAFLGESARVSDLRIEFSRIEGKTHVGLLAGISFGTVSCCSVSGFVSADDRAGGMFGTFRGSLTSCMSCGGVTGDRILGGLVGHSLARSSITGCHAMTKVRGRSHVGGLVGQMLPGTLVKCFASGSVTSGSNAGGLVGSGPLGGTIVRCNSSVSVKGTVVGGLAGIAQRTNIYDCHVFGFVTKIESGTDTSGSGPGGIVGYWRGGAGSIISSTWNTDITRAEVAVGRSSPHASVDLQSTLGRADFHAKRPRFPFRKPFPFPPPKRESSF